MKSEIKFSINFVFCRQNLLQRNSNARPKAKLKEHGGYSLVLGLNIHIKVRLKALGNNAMERIVRGLWLLWL